MTGPKGFRCRDRPGHRTIHDVPEKRRGDGEHEARDHEQGRRVRAPVRETVVTTAAARAGRTASPERPEQERIEHDPAQEGRGHRAVEEAERAPEEDDDEHDIGVAPATLRYGNKRWPAGAPPRTAVTAARARRIVVGPLGADVALARSRDGKGRTGRLDDTGVRSRAATGHTSHARPLVLARAIIGATAGSADHSSRPRTSVDPYGVDDRAVPRLRLARGHVRGQGHGVSVQHRRVTSGVAHRDREQAGSATPVRSGEPWATASCEPLTPASRP